MLTTRSPNSYSEDNVDIFNHVSAKRFKLYDELKLLEFHYKLLINSHRSPNEGRDLPRRPSLRYYRHSTMFLKVQLPWNVIIAAENLKPGSLMLQRAILIRLLSDFAAKKATKDMGYFLAVTTLDKIGEGKVRQHTGDVLFPVVFNAVTFKVFKGEVLEGVVHKVLKHGVFLRIGPIENAYLSSSKMPGYVYVLGENPYFMNQKMPKIAKDVVVRVVVIGTKWMEAEREFQALVGLEGDYLGPVSSPDM
ncbi:DNA-directed RNA polymerase V subunit 7 [Trifolium repens]|nr:DNA-directed RNA polymerase V subunit 7 [Trifolium repens]